MSATIEIEEIKAEGGTESGDLRACRGCLATDLPLFDLRSKGLAQIFGDFTGIPVLPTDTYPQQVCVMCKYLLTKFFAFRARCHSAMCVLQQLVQDGVEVSTELLSALDTSLLRPNLHATYVQVVGSDYSAEAITNVVDTLSNAPPANAEYNVGLIKTDPYNDTYYFVDEKNNGNIDLPAVVMEDSGGGDNEVSCVLSNNEVWPTEIELNMRELPMKCEGVNKKNVTCKRPRATERAIKKETKGRIKIEDADEEQDEKVEIEINDLGDNDNNVSFALIKSNKSQSISKFEASKLPTKRKPVNKGNATRKRPKKKDDKIDITAAEIKDSGDVDNSKLPAKRKPVNKGNATCKRPKKKHDKIDTSVEIEDSGDDDNSISSALSESDEWPSDSELNERKLSTKRKRVNEENVTCKRPRKRTSKKETEGSDEAQDILKSMGNIIKSARNMCRDGSHTSLWEKVYQASLQDTHTHEPLDCKDLNQWSLTQKINQYICLSKKLAALFNSELKFSCLADQKKEMEDRRTSEQYLNARFKCEFCFKHYKFKDTYKRHMLSHDLRSGDVVCEICLYRFKTQKRFAHHFRRHTKTITCKACGVVSREWSNAKHHFKWHGGAETVCDQCGKHFARRKLYIMHRMSMHRAEFATALCLLCGDTYNGPFGLRVHMQIAHRECPRCSTCNKQFASADALAVHNADSGTGCLTLSACPVCGHNFPSEHSMQEHYDTQHKGEFKCDQCGHVTDTLSQFTRHERQCMARRWRGRLTANEIGLGIVGMPREPREPREPRATGRRKITCSKKKKEVYDPKLICEWCGKRNFTCISTLRSHQRVHTGERPFQCQLCHKTFRGLQHLKDHMKTHTDERRYKCPHCPKAFRQGAHRVAHILTHTKERPYKCDLCSKCYTGQTSLKEHVDTAHKGLPPRRRGKNKEIN